MHIATPMAYVENNNNSTSRIIATLHPDIIYSHILTRLDGPTLASAAASSPEFRRLITQNHLWHNICSDIWPSLNDPLTSSLISTFPSGHLSIFSDSFPSPSFHHHRPLSSLPPLLKLISAVDIYYNGKPFFSRVHSIETQKGWFLRSPLWVDIIEKDETVPIPLTLERNIDDDNDNVELLSHLEEYLTLSWIVIDSTWKRAANLSSHTAIVAQPQWPTGDLEVVYAMMVEEEVQCSIKVTCCMEAEAEIHVREVSMTMEGVDGRHVTGRESMVILHRAMQSVKRNRIEREEAKESYEKFCGMKRERIERLMRTYKEHDMVAGATKIVAISAGVMLFVWIWII